jgi:type IV pilus assembly protein PilY1
MNKRTLTSTLSAATAAALIGLAGSARAEDIDLFVNGASSTPADNPNIIFVIDNTANWNRNDSHWVDPNGLIAPYKQGQSELRALKRLIEESNDKVNVGLMLFHRGSPKGTYVRYAVRQMTAANKAALAELIGDETCVDGVGANGTPKCIYKNFSGTEQVPQSASDYSGALFEAFKYLGGCTSPAYAQSDICKTSPLGTTGFGIERYSNSVTLSASDKIRYDQAAYTNTAKRFYIPPASSTASCAATNAL